jgi:glycosyltransferase involved in cell wall biosynthesis
MDELVDKLYFAGIPFTWECFSDADPHIKGITFRGMIPDIRTEIRAADYLVQLSDAEGFCYSIVEALQEGTAVITTPVEVLSEIGFVDGEHGYTIPFDMDFDVHKLTHVPHFIYTYDNEPSITKWKSILGESSGASKPVHIRCIKDYRDMVMNQQIHYGDILTVSEARANEIIAAGYGLRLS